MIVVALAAMLTGCANGTIVVKNNYIVVDPPKQLLNCDQKKIPTPDVTKLTEAELGHVVLVMQTHLQTCRNNSQAIKNYIAKAKARAATLNGK